VTLTPLQERFVDEFLVDLNALRAYARSSPGAARTTCATNGPRMLKTPAVEAAIKIRTDALAAKLAVTRENVLAEYARIAYSNIDTALVRDDLTGKILGADLSRLSSEQIAAVKEINFQPVAKPARRRRKGERGKSQPVIEQKLAQVKLHDKIQALHKLGAHLRLFADDEVQPFTQVTFNVIRTRDRVAPKRRPPMEKPNGK
jgi:phage terminase small subunit